MNHVLLAALLAACSGPSKEAPPPAPVLAETPPRTSDPGAVLDTRPLQDSTQPPPEGDAAGTGSGALKADGASCLAPGECASGICEGEGCGPSKPGRCAPRSRSCTRDLRPYCSCEGKTFHTSGNCPGQRFAARAECTTP